MSCCGLLTPGSVMVTCESARPPDYAGTTLANPNNAQSTNRQRKSDLKRWDRITELDTRREPLLPLETKLTYSSDNLVAYAAARFSKSARLWTSIALASPITK